MNISGKNTSLTYIKKKLQATISVRERDLEIRNYNLVYQIIQYTFRQRPDFQDKPSIPSIY